jgi:hypothetical protein
MQTLDLRRDPELADSVTVRELAQLAAEVRRAYPDLTEPLLAPWSVDPAVVLDGGRTWVITSVEQDPQARGGRAVVPWAQRKELKRLAARELPVQRLAAGHECDPTGPAAQLIPLLREGPRTCTAAVARTLVGPVPPHPGVARAARWVDAVVGGTRRAIAELALLDPIIFGIVAPTPPVHGQPCLWFPLCAWRW